MASRVNSLHYLSHGVPFCLRSETEELLSRMTEQLPFGSNASVEVADATVFSLDSRHCLPAELEASLERLRTDLMVHVADRAPERVFVHAGVVGWQGRAIVLPGTSFAGKTTLVAALVRAGAAYYSDEYAVVDAEGLVHPYARDLQMRQPGRPEQRAVSVDSLQGLAGTAPLAVAQVVFAEYAAGGHWNPQPVSPGMAVLEMLRHTIPVQRTPARVMATLTRMMRDAQAFRSARGEADATAAALLAALP
jgi:hypothetical protein